MAAGATSIWLASEFFVRWLGVEPLSQHPRPVSDILVPLILLTVCYFSLNSWLVTFAVALQRRLSPIRVWRDHFAWLSLNCFSGASLAALLVPYTERVNISALGLILPLLIISYLTFKTAMSRVEDSTRHLSELNRLYISTIETLAMAIDAKDQITHGHIRRVQTYAVALARRVGVSDEALIKAIEAAALLHDMGKLAVPEYILNKPGKLTTAEFEKMKRHATVGADILSAIDFPYPVVPIVRHHHENWDGSGYPQGLKGTEIPIGARVLAVVDCFDALTSDRPYRPRLPNDEALRILLERRSSMYDPLIVDTFVRVHDEITRDAARTGLPEHALVEITGSSSQAAQAGASDRLDDIAASADEMLTVYEFAQALAGHSNIDDAGEIVAKYLRRLVPSSLCVIYLYDPAIDELEARHAIGEANSVVKGLRIPLGQRLSGWVAANRHTILNSDPTLDLGDVARRLVPRLRSCLSTPLVVEEALVGVLTLYSSAVDGYSDDHRRVVEGIARQIAHILRHAAPVVDSSNRDAVTGLPNSAELERAIKDLDRTRARGSLVFINLVDLSQVRLAHGGSVSDEVLRQVVQRAKSVLTVGDTLYRQGVDELVVLLSDAFPAAAASVADRIRNAIRRHDLSTRAGSLNIDAMVTTASAPDDGESFQALMATSRNRLTTFRSQQGSRVH
jgi:diguanylate cyclase (GGDEF)-like protein/putative nucleotidyltransferase with HDIG domain